ncbi:TNF receptor-associated factor 5-like isoform X2 [Hydractinia symbiolongicarpus]|nr:TNF receptor-associated factor 5-like isoform X2 [Hydractinia symbiolongicarpus]
MINRVILSVKVKCQHASKGCEWNGTVDEVQNHLGKNCEYELLTCPYEGCNMALQRRLLDEHERQCLYRLHNCGHCEKPIVFKDLEEHLKLCDFLILPCPNGCSGYTAPRVQMRDHINTTCKYQIVPCTFAFAGCKSQIHREFLERHKQLSTKYHLEIVMSENKRLQVVKANVDKHIQAEITWYSEKIICVIKKVVEPDKLKKIMSRIDKNVHECRVNFADIVSQFDQDFCLLKGELKSLHDFLEHEKTKIRDLVTGFLYDIPPCLVTEHIETMKEEIFPPLSSWQTINEVTSENLNLYKEDLRMQLEENLKKLPTVCPHERFHAMLELMDLQKLYVFKTFAVCKCDLEIEYEEGLFTCILDTTNFGIQKVAKKHVDCIHYKRLGMFRQNINEIIEARYEEDVDLFHFDENVDELKAQRFIEHDVFLLKLFH